MMLGRLSAVGRLMTQQRMFICRSFGESAYQHVTLQVSLALSINHGD